MNNALNAVRGALTDLANAIDDAKDSNEITDAGVEALNPRWSSKSKR